MSSETDFIADLRAFATHPAARGLLDDAAVLEIGGHTLVLTKDLLVEGVHYLTDDPPGDVAWKLVAVNLSDLAAKGARPIGVLLGFMLSDEAWDRAFADGLGRCLAAFDVALLGGDTVAAAGPRVLSLTALGQAAPPVPSRGGAAAGDHLWVSGSIGDAGAGLAILLGELSGDESLVRRYRAPQPRLAAGRRLAPLVSAMMDVSDGLLLDVQRMAAASGLAATIELGSVPLSGAFFAMYGDGRAARLRAATAGDDYELLFATPSANAGHLPRLAEELDLSLTRIGRFEAGKGLTLTDHGAHISMPDRLGYEHRQAND